MRKVKMKRTMMHGVLGTDDLYCFVFDTQYDSVSAGL